MNAGNASIMRNLTDETFDPLGRPAALSTKRIVLLRWPELNLMMVLAFDESVLEEELETVVSRWLAG